MPEVKQIQEVLVTTSDGKPFDSADVITVSVAPESLLPSHPLEDGSVIADTMVRKNTRLNMTLVLNPETYKDAYEEIKRINREAVECTIQTKADTYYNMYLASFPHEENAARFDTISISLAFVEQIFVTFAVQTLSIDDVSNPSNSSTNDRGDQLGEDKGTLALNTVKTTIDALSGLIP